jgi:hypothetical protein
MNDLWSQQHAARAAELWQLYFADHYGEEKGPRGARERVLHLIAKDLNRNIENIVNRFDRYGAPFGCNQVSKSIASANAIAERDARQFAEGLRNDTSRFFGDPAPGFSALDRKRKGLPA